MKHAPWLLVFVCALSVHATPSAAAAADKDPATEGRLVTRRDGKVIDVPLEHTEVAIRVDGHLAEATVTQRFRNPYAAKIEAVYLFPLPTNAAVNGMTLTSGSRTIRGTIQERAKATQTYVAARDRGLVAALLTQERPNLFTQSVANLEPSATIEVSLTYVQRLTYEDGGYELVFPMVAGPRYVPAGSAAAKDASAVQPAVLPPGLRSSHDIGLRVELDAGVPIERLESPSHQLAIERPAGAPARATVKIRPTDTIPNKDFVLRYRVAGDAPRFGVLAHRAGGTGSFVLLAQPPAAPPDAQIAPREIVFALDTSSSMRGLPLAKARDVIRRILRKLGPDDTFQIVRFDDQASALGPAPIANRPRNVELVLDWLDRLDAGGGTEMVTGIDAALAVPHDPLRLRIVVFLTDGYVGNEDEILGNVAKRMGDARLFSFGVGTAVNRYLLEELAAIGRGAAQFVRPDEDSAAAVDAFERRIARPVLTDLRIDWGGLAVTDASPRAIPDLFAGQPLVLAGHYTAPGSGAVTVHGRQAGREVRFQVPVTLPVLDAARPAVAAVWARQRIAELSRRLVRAADPALEQEVRALSLEHRLLTRYTAFVAVDEARVTAGGKAQRVVVPVEVPDAVRAIADRSVSYGYGASGSYGYGASGGVLGYSVSGGSGGGGTGWGSIGVGRYGSVSAGRASGMAIERRESVVPPAPSSAADSPLSGDVVADINASRAPSTGGMRGRHARVVTFTIPAPDVEGGELHKDIVRRYVRRKQVMLTYCYEKELLTSPTLGGTVRATFTITEGGTVSGTATSGLGNATVEACIASTLASIEFPRPRGGPVRVTYTFELQPPPSESP
ncbi:MAG TPA: VIT domain-containing protein [Kofleriaceae bacterium]|nr:VIT domain-containing protein [Kofleriaceae bacterium]